MHRDSDGVCPGMRKSAASQFPRRLYAPLGPAAIGLCIGVILDRFAIPFATSTWVGIAVLFFAITFARSRAILICAAFVAVGGARHHLAWSDVREDDISLG